MPLLPHGEGMKKGHLTSGNAVKVALTRWSGRQDSNLRSPAPKAGALATTLRPVSSRLSQREHRQLSGTPRHSANETPLQRQFRHFDTDRMASAMTSGRSNIMR